MSFHTSAGAAAAAASSPGSGWTSRRRLLTALAGKQADRVPISTYELVGYNSRAWENQEPSYRSLMDRIRADTDCLAMWNTATNELCMDDTGTILGSAFPVPTDTVRERREGCTRTTQVMHTPGGDLRQVFEVYDNVHTVWCIEHWCKDVVDVDKALSVPFEPVTYDAGDYPRIREEVGDHGLIMSSLADPAYTVASLMSFQDFPVWAFEETEHFARAVDIMAERTMENLRRLLDTCVVDLYRICGPEYMTPPFLPPRFFERFMVPHVKAMTDLIHQRGSKVRLHCHGRIGQVLDMFFQTGCDGTDPCEPPPDGDIELDEVKRRCAAHGVCVFGNIELKVLESGSTAQVRQAVRRAMDQAKAGGGFVLMPTAAPINIPLADKTRDNYLAYIDAALEFGGY